MSIGLGSSFKIFKINPPWLLAVKGFLYVHKSYNIQPKAHISLLSLYGLSSQISGDK